MLGAKLVESKHPDTQQSESTTRFLQAGQTFVEHSPCQPVRWNSSNGVEAAIYGWGRFSVARLDCLFEQNSCSFDRVAIPDDCLASDGDCHAVSEFVQVVGCDLSGLAVPQRSHNRTVIAAQDMPVLIARSMVGAVSPHNFVRKMSNDLLGAAIPETNSVVPVDKIDAYRQLFQERVKEARIVEEIGRHGTTSSAIGFIGNMGEKLQRTVFARLPSAEKFLKVGTLVARSKRRALP